LGVKLRDEASKGFVTDSRDRVLIPTLLVGFVLLSGCATYSEKLADVRRDADRGAYPAALDRVNDVLGVRSVEELPAKWKGDRALAVLERAVLLQAQGEFALSARDLSGGETELELLDLKTDTAGQIGKYVYSDSSQDYEASPTERLFLNALNMANYLALGKLEGAAVEARRFTNMRAYLSSINLEKTGTFGAYLAGFVFEHLGEGDRALRYYEEALEAGRLDSLAAPVARLARRNPYRGPRLDALLGRAGVAAAGDESAPAEVLVVLALGRVPHKVPERIPIGAAVGIAGTFITGNPAILERSLFKVVVYPELAKTDTPARQATVEIDGRAAAVEVLSSLGTDIRKEYELIKPRILGAALTRMIARAAAAEGARLAGQQSGGGAGQIVGLLAALAAEGSLVALDKPDTRSWTLLPDRIAVSRVAVRPGDHRVEVRVPGVAEPRTVPVQVGEGGFAVVVVTIPR
jgi:tetratricopeptide (TPR) repeat protein